MSVRRVVTGHDESGKSVFVSDTQMAPISLLPGFESYSLWGTDVAPTFPDPGVEPVLGDIFPPVGGVRFGVFSLVPSDVDPVATGNDADVMEADDPGMHRTDSIDFTVVLSGQVVLELDDGAEVTLSSGDTVIQNGTRHRWKSVGDEPVVVAAFMAGAYRRS